MLFKHQVRCYHFSIVRVITVSVSLIQMSRENRKVITMMESNQLFIKKYSTYQNT